MQSRPRERGIEVVLATNDKDLYQLVNSTVKIYSTAKADLGSPKDAFALLGEEQVTAKWDIPPAMIGDVLALAGDAVDNIRGIGIGRKAAAKLLREFGNLDALLNSIDQIKTPKTRDKLEKGREQILQNRKMVELDCHLPLPVPIEDLQHQAGLSPPDRIDGEKRVQVAPAGSARRSGPSRARRAG